MKETFFHATRTHTLGLDGNSCVINNVHVRVWGIGDVVG